MFTPVCDSVHREGHTWQGACVEMGGVHGGGHA